MTTEAAKHVSDQQRLTTLEQRTYHIDGEVSGIKSTLATHGNTLQRIETKLLNSPGGMNSSQVLGVLTAVGGVVFGLVTYFHTLISPIEKKVELYDQFRYEMHYEIGVMQHSFENYDERWQHFDVLHHKQDDAIRALAEKAAAAEISRRAMGEYMKELAGKQ